MEWWLVAGGIGIGMMSGFFGIGGGTITVPYLLYLGYGIKQAIGISAMQMVLSSFAGSWLHQQQKSYELKEVIWFGIGGAIGAVIGGILVKLLDAKLLGWLFLGIVAFTLIRLFLASPHPSGRELNNRFLNLLIGVGVGIFSGMLGVGGSILMTPILVSFLGFGLKKASAVGLSFVMFTSVAGSATLYQLGFVNLYDGALLGSASLLGVWLGIHLLKITGHGRYKQAIVLFYIIIFILTAKKLLA
ncbi:MAG: sulfite exporter TauE/SafE family protein [Campylobacterales bacterium]